ncbi:MAG TPA: hypothetical protein IAB06_07700 [Candidatus Avacidaminococcus intestinavium]|uniref:Uncharacterized protein n=1 Tax=Candidatus Avacidaminococcus intestinavium TaxID=2840684 RepID=A0A9D1MR35_9FIRM|nr:hypothetical protein [Candidatus Avacidaminococcus intestinavium]
MGKSKISVGLVNSTYSNGWIGSVESDGTMEAVAVNEIISGTAMTTDPRVIPISTTGTLRTLINSYAYGGVGGLGQQGSALYGIYNPTGSGTPSTWGSPIEKAQSNQSSPVTGVQEWSVSNPYTAAVLGNTMYLSDNDNVSSDLSARIYSYDMTGDAFTQNELATAPFYKFVPGNDPSSNPYKGAGTGLELYNDGTDDYLIATFNRYNNTGWTYNFGPSELVKIKISDGSNESVSLNHNSSGVVVEGDFAYVTSVGGAQVTNGNPLSKLEMVDISLSPDVLPNALDVTKSNSVLSGFSGGDYIDVAFVGTKAYVLLAHYYDEDPKTYVGYKYAIIQTTANDLQNGGFGIAPKFITGTTNPASPTFALLPSGLGELYFVDGVNIKLIDTSVDIDQTTPTNAISLVKTAGDFENYNESPSVDGYVLNTAGVVIEKTPTAMALKAGAKRASVTKMAKRLARPEDLERDKK